MAISHTIMSILVAGLLLAPPAMAAGPGDGMETVVELLDMSQQREFLALPSEQQRLLKTLVFYVNLKVGSSWCAQNQNSFNDTEASTIAKVTDKLGLEAPSPISQHIQLKVLTDSLPKLPEADECAMIYNLTKIILPEVLRKP